jgi:hypothetical protein
VKKKGTWALLALALLAIVAFGGCGKDGKAYGSITWVGSIWVSSTFDSTSGFPSSDTIVKNTEYSISEGSYSFKYYLYYNGYYYPSGVYWYAVSYTVKYNSGKLFSDGDDKHFKINCGTNGATYSGLSRIGPAPSLEAIASGSYSETYGGDGITVTLNVQRVPRDEASTKSAVELK